MSTSTATSHAASPITYPSNGGQGQGQEGELFSLDFLALAGLDSGMSAPQDMTSPTSPINGHNHLKENHSIQHQLQHWEQSSNQAGPSTYSHLQAHPHAPSQNSAATGTRTTSNDVENDHPRARGRSNGSRKDAENAMDLDQPDLDRLAQTQQDGINGIDSGGGSQEYDALQAALLQHQLQGIHMQSPLGFDINNPQFPLAQMFLSSPGAQMAQLQQFMQSENGGQEASKPKHRGSIDRNWQPGLGGMPTPGPSGEIIPQNRQEAMSPMHLEMLARAQSEFGGDPNMLPLLSPALSHATSTSFNSPSTQIAFNAQSQQAPGQQGGNRSPLEQLQEQQRQFQEQLAVLQQRQLEMQATAAAVVAASSNSPFVGGSNPSSGPSRPATTPGTAMTPTSAGFFSPLTSPALEATNRVQQQHFNRHQFSPAFNAQQARTPHPLSALSSPALNPVGSSGGAQQTLSPALGPQTGADLSDPDYLRALVGMLDGDPQGIGQSAQQANYNSPSMASSSSAGHSTILASPALIPTNPSGTGPHRHSLPAKSRPSPMLKPTNHRSHHQRVPSVTPNGNGHGTFSVPTSPAVQKFHPNPPQPNMVNMGFLPPSAIENRNLAPSTTSMSSASTPSPVDLSHIMPPPPVPSNNTSKTRKGVAPMTPASLMNLGSAPPNLDLHQNQNFMMEDTRLGPNGAIPPPAPAPAKRGASGNAGKTTRKQNVSSSNGAGTGKKGAGNKAVPVGGGTGGGKRTLAIRPQSGAASRAVKPPPPPSEPEHRKTSHKAAEQKRRDSLKAGFDELRLLLPPINVEALDPESGEPIPGSSAPRLLPKSSLVPDDNPNRGVSKVALLRFGNEYIERLKERVDRRDNYIERLRKEVTKLRASASETDTDIQEGLDDEELNLDDDEAEDEEAEDQGDVLDYDWREGEEEEFDPPALTLALPDDILDEDGNAELLDGEGASEGEEGGIDGEEVDENMETAPAQIQKKKNGATNNNNNNKKSKASSFTSASNGNSLTSKSPALKAVASSRRPSLLRGNSSTATVTSKK